MPLCSSVYRRWMGQTTRRAGLESSNFHLLPHRDHCVVRIYRPALVRSAQSLRHASTVWCIAPYSLRASVASLTLKAPQDLPIVVLRVYRVAYRASPSSRVGRVLTLKASTLPSLLVSITSCGCYASITHRRAHHSLCPGSLALRAYRAAYSRSLLYSFPFQMSDTSHPLAALVPVSSG